MASASSFNLQDPNVSIRTFHVTGLPFPFIQSPRILQMIRSYFPRESFSMTSRREPSSSFNKRVPNMRYCIPTFSTTLRSYRRGRVGLFLSVSGVSSQSLCFILIGPSFFSVFEHRKNCIESTDVWREAEWVSVEQGHMKAGNTFNPVSCMLSNT